jgi:hypothetical protein
MTETTISHKVKVERETGGRNKGCWIVDATLIVGVEEVASCAFYLDKTADHSEAVLCGVEATYDILQEMVENGEITL